MFVRKKKYPSGNIGTIVVEKIGGKMKEHATIGVAYNKGEIDTGGQRNMGIDYDAGLFLDVPRTVITCVSPSNILACLYRIGFLDGADDLFWCELRAGWDAQLCLTNLLMYIHSSYNCLLAMSFSVAVVVNSADGTLAMRLHHQWHIFDEYVTCIKP